MYNVCRLASIASIASGGTRVHASQVQDTRAQRHCRIRREILEFLQTGAGPKFRVKLLEGEAALEQLSAQVIWSRLVTVEDKQEHTDLKMIKT